MSMMMYQTSEKYLARIGQSSKLSARNFHYACAICGVLCSLFFFFAFVAAGFLPPVKPYWTAEETVAHYRSHLIGIHVGSALLLISGMFYLPLTACISAQMRRIPKLHYAVSALQLASGAAGIFTFMMPAMILAATAFRLDRPVEITQALNELFWITALMPWPTFMAQNFAFAYAIMIDQRERSLFPKWIAIVNIAVPIIFVPGIAIHTTMTGPLAWNGVWSFWLAGLTFCVQLIVDSFCLARAVRNEAPGGEMIVDIFPNLSGIEQEDSERKTSENSA